MAYSLATAAETAGVQKSTVFRWIKAGKLSATRIEDGQYRIDPAELQRFLDTIAKQPAPQKTPERTETGSAGEGRASATDAEMQRQADALRSEVAKLQALLEVERQRAAEWKETADRWAAQAERLALPAATPMVTPAPASEPVAPQRGGLFGWLRRA